MYGARGSWAPVAEMDNQVQLYGAASSLREEHPPSGMTWLDKDQL